MRHDLTLTEFSADAAEWGAALADLTQARGAALQQHWAYGRIAQAGGRRVARLVLRQGARSLGVVQMLGRGGLWLASRGPVFAPDCAPDLRRACIRALAARAGLVLVTPETPLAGRGLVPLVTPRHQALWSLGPEPAHLRAGLAAKWRNRLAAAERAGLGVGPLADPGWLIRAEAAQRARRGYRGLPADFITAWGLAVPGGVLGLQVLDSAGQPMAGVVMLRHGAQASYHLGWSGDAGRASGAHNLLLWHAALALRAQGVRLLDLGDVNSEQGAGLMHFKLGTGAQAHSLGATCLAWPF